MNAVSDAGMGITSMGGVAGGTGALATRVGAALDPDDAWGDGTLETAGVAGRAPQAIVASEHAARSRMHARTLASGSPRTQRMKVAFVGHMGSNYYRRRRHGRVPG
jgi:hypothetical protein